MKPYTLYKRKTKKSRVHIYYARFKDEETEKIILTESTGCTTKTDAEKWAINRLKNLRKDIILNKDKTTLAGFCEDFFVWGKCNWIKKQHAHGDSFSRYSAKQRRAQLVNYILPRFGNYRMDKIKAAEIQDFLLKLDKSNQTKNHILYCFKTVLDEALFREYIEYNPVLQLKHFSLDKKKGHVRERGILTLDEIKRLFPEDTEKLKSIWDLELWWTFFYLLLTTGARLSEGRALIWCNIIWDSGFLHITNAIKSDGTRGKPKNNQERAVILPDRTILMLQAWRKNSPYDSENDLIFPGLYGDNPMNKKTAYDHFIKGLTNAKIDRGDRWLTTHSLRHCYNSYTRNILNDELLRFMVGHSDEKMTENYDGTKAIERLQRFAPDRSKLNDIWQ